MPSPNYAELKIAISETPDVASSYKTLFLTRVQKEFNDLLDHMATLPPHQEVDLAKVDAVSLHTSRAQGRIERVIAEDDYLSNEEKESIAKEITAGLNDVFEKTKEIMNEHRFTTALSAWERDMSDTHDKADKAATVEDHTGLHEEGIRKTRELRDTLAGEAAYAPLITDKYKDHFAKLDEVEKLSLRKRAERLLTEAKHEFSGLRSEYDVDAEAALRRSELLVESIVTPGFETSLVENPDLATDAVSFVDNDLRGKRTEYRSYMEAERSSKLETMNRLIGVHKEQIDKIRDVLASIGELNSAPLESAGPVLEKPTAKEEAAAFDDVMQNAGTAFYKQIRVFEDNISQLQVKAHDFDRTISQKIETVGGSAAMQRLNDILDLFRKTGVQIAAPVVEKEEVAVRPDVVRTTDKADQRLDA